MEIVNPFVSDNELINVTCNTLEYIFLGNRASKVSVEKFMSMLKFKIYFSHCTFPSSSY